MADLTLGATWRRLIELGYSPTSATHPDRIVNNYAGRRDSILALSGHPAAVACHPTIANGAHESLEDCNRREVVGLVLTAYLLSDKRQAAAVQAVLEEYKLLGGPVRLDAFGNQLRPLQWAGNAIFDGEHSCRLAFDDDDRTVFLQHAIAPQRFTQHTSIAGVSSRVPFDPVGTHVIQLDGEWKGGGLLETPRDRLPELLAADIARLISDCEEARWEARPASRGAAA